MTRGSQRAIDLDGFRRSVADELAALFAELEPRRYYRMLTYHLGQTDRDGRSLGDGASAGKLLRPTLCLLACAAVGGEPTVALPAAAAVELIHSFSLLHDDIEDRSAERRHRPTVWTIWGDAHAINAGDGMFSLAQVALLNSAARGVPPERVVAVAAALGRTCLRLCEGQFLDMEAERGESLDEAAYLALIGGKSAALLACSAEIGAILGGGTPQQVDGLREYGYRVGLAFQMQDDILGIWGDPAVTGKPAHDDIRFRKQSLPMIHAGVARPTGERAQRPADDDEVTAVLGQLESADSRAYVEARAAVYVRAALAALATDPPLQPAARDLLAHQATALIGRDR